jgi:hypothetical protein
MARRKPNTANKSAKRDDSVAVRALSTDSSRNAHAQKLDENPVFSSEK